MTLAKKEVVKKPVVKDFSKIFENKLNQLEATIQALNDKIAELSVNKEPAVKLGSIHKTELTNFEYPAEAREESKFRMTYPDMIQSATNAVKILPPNLIVDGRHSAENIGAICGFRVSDDMMDDIYRNFAHEV